MNITGYVIYPDGGCRPNPNGYGGAGIHGYKWTLASGNKGIGHNSHAATVQGYEPKSESGEFATKAASKDELADKQKMLDWLANNQKAKVAVDVYYDMSVPIELGASNNLAELQAATHSLETLKADAIANEASLVQMRCDSQYVILGFTQYLPNWIGNNFIKRDGTTVANEDMWRRLWLVYQEYDKAGISISFKHVKGHGSCPGNNNADYLATTGVMNSRSFKLTPFYKETESQGYWKTGGDEKHPFFNLRFAFFTTEETARATPGTYYTSSQGKVVELIGKKISGSMFGLIKLAQPVELIESIVEHQKTLPSDVDYLCLLDVDAVYGQQWRYLNMIGPSYAYKHQPHRKDLVMPDGTFLTKELNPAYLAVRTIEVMDDLEDVLAQYKSKAETVVITDITNSFYEFTEEKVRVKKGEPEAFKTVCKLKSDIIVGYSVHCVDVDYHTIDKEVKSIDLRLTLGIDLPDRNCLKRLEATSPKVSIVTWNVGHGVFLYATVIESGDDIGIWSGVYSNIRMTPEAAEATKTSKAAKDKKK